MTAARALQLVVENGGPVLRLVRRRAPRSVVPRDRGTRRIVVGLLGGILVIGVVFFVLLEQVVLAQSAFRLEQLRDEVARAEARHEELLLRAATLESPVRIEGFARHQLGMVDPDPATIQYLVADIPAGGRLAFHNDRAGTGFSREDAAAAAASALP